MTIIVKRTLFDEVADHLESPEITIITGARQVGKTTLLKQLKKYLIDKGTREENVYNFNLDIISDRNSFVSQDDFIRFIKSRVKKEKICLFIDEAQRVENAGIFFKGIYDLNLPVKFILTGSSTLEIKSKIHEPLTGRKRLFHLRGFSFREFLGSREPKLAEILSDSISNIDKNKILAILKEYLVFGGYPKVALESNHNEKKKLLEELFSSYLEKDIIGYMNIKDSFSFTKLTRLLASQIGQLVNVAELSKTIGIEIKTINNYLSYLEETFVIKLLRPFYKNPRKEITKMPKVYFLDLGLCNFAVSKFDPYEQREDTGKLLENFVFTELQNLGLRTNFWRTKSKGEIDFIVHGNKGEIIPVEVKSSNLKNLSLGRSFHSFLSQYKPNSAYLVNMGIEESKKEGTTLINAILPFNLSKLTSEEPA